MFRSKRGPLIAGAIAVALVVLFILFLVLPQQGKVAQARDELAAAEAQTSTLETQLAALEQAELAAPEAKATIEAVQRQIPLTLDQSGYLRLIKNAAARSSIVATTQSSGTPSFDSVTGLSTVSIAITANGTYFSLAEFLYSLETLPRAAKVVNVTLAPGVQEGATTNQLQMQASVVLFTSDVSAGPGSEPGPTGADEAAVAGTG